jgi:hypothetical protein
LDVSILKAAFSHLRAVCGNAPLGVIFSNLSRLNVEPKVPIDDDHRWDPTVSRADFVRGFELPSPAELAVASGGPFDPVMEWMPHHPAPVKPLPGVFWPLLAKIVDQVTVICVDASGSMRSVCPLLNERKWAAACEFVAAIRAGFAEFRPAALVGTVCVNIGKPAVIWGLGVPPEMGTLKPAGNTDIWGSVAAVSEEIRLISKELPARIILVTDGSDEPLRQFSTAQKLRERRIVVDTILFPGSSEAEKRDPNAAISAVTLGVAICPTVEKKAERLGLVGTEAFVDLRVRRPPRWRPIEWELDRDRFLGFEGLRRFHGSGQLNARPFEEILREVGEVVYDSKFRDDRIAKELRICQLFGRNVVQVNRSQWRVLLMGEEDVWWHLAIVFPWNYPWARPIFRVEAFKCADRDIPLGRVPDNWSRCSDDRPEPQGERVETLLRILAAGLKVNKRGRRLMRQWDGEGKPAPVDSPETWELYREPIPRSLVRDPEAKRHYRSKIEAAVAKRQAM